MAKSKLKTKKLIKPSKKLFIIFGAAFVLVGLYFVYNSFAAGPTAAKPQCSITASNAAVTQGERITLSYLTYHTTSVSAPWLPKAKAKLVSNAVTVMTDLAAGKSAKYSLTVKGNGGTNTCGVTIANKTSARDIVIKNLKYYVESRSTISATVNTNSTVTIHYSFPSSYGYWFFYGKPMTASANGKQVAVKNPDYWRSEKGDIQVTGLESGTKYTLYLADPYRESSCKNNMCINLAGDLQTAKTKSVTFTTKTVAH